MAGKSARARRTQNHPAGTRDYRQCAGYICPAARGIRALPLVKTIGGEAGRDFATIALFNAAWGVAADLPLTQVQDVEARIYGANADGSAGTYASVTVPTITMATAGACSLTYRGMLGNVWEGGQVSITGSGDGFNCRHYNGVIVCDNLSVTTTGNQYTAISLGAAGHQVIRCRAVTNSATSNGYALNIDWAPGYVRDCFLYAPIYGTGVLCSSSTAANAKIENSIIVTLGGRTTSSYAQLHPCIFENCTCYGRYITAGLGQGDCSPLPPMRNCILYSTTELYPDSSAAVASPYLHFVISSCLRSCNIISADGKFMGGQTLAAWAGNYADWYANNGVISTPPGFVGGDLATPQAYALQEDSPCRRLNQSIRASGVNPSAQIERVTIGASIDSWDEDPLSENEVHAGNTYAGGTKNGNRTDCPSSGSIYGYLYGISGILTSGQYNPINPNGVLTTYNYGYNSTESGKYVHVDSSSVLSSVYYAISGMTLGRYEVPDNTKYLEGNTYGIDGISETGTMVNENPVYSTLMSAKQETTISCIKEGEEIELLGGITYKFDETADISISIELLSGVSYVEHHDFGIFENIILEEMIEKTFYEINSNKYISYIMTTKGNYRWKIIVNNGTTSEIFYSYFSVIDKTAPGRPSNVSINMPPAVPKITGIS